MEEEYVRESKIIEKTEEEKELELMISILKARKELEEANKNFEYAEEELIDYYTYQIKASRSKLDYLVKKAKSKGASMDMIKRIEIKYNKAI
ncbi:MAG: DUF2508 family protein [Clostridia bacterium]|nr:DUF2508 family protein [Clostridia bacterium]